MCDVAKKIEVDIKDVGDEEVIFVVKNSKGQSFEIGVFDCESGNLGISVGIAPTNDDSRILDLYVTPDLYFYGG